MSDKIEVTKEDTTAEVAPAVEEKAEIRKGVNLKHFIMNCYHLTMRELGAVALFKDHMLEEYGIKDRKELVSGMFELMHKYGGIGLSAYTSRITFNMFVAGGHKSVENGLKLAMFNPVIMSSSKEEVLMKEGW